MAKRSTLLHPPAAGGQPVDPRSRDRLRPRGSADGRTGAVRLALRPRVRHGGDRVRGAVPGRGAPTATTRGHLAYGPTGGLAARLRGAVVRDVVRHRPVHAGDVQHAHGRPHAVVDAGADPAGAGRAGHPRVAGAAGRRARRTARHARVAAGRVAQPGLADPHQPVRRDRAVRRRLLRPLPRWDLRRRGGQSRRPRRDEPALPAVGLPVLLGGHRRRPDPAAHPIAGEAGDGLRVLAAARVLRGRADGHADCAGRDILQIAPIALAYRFIGRSAAGRRHRLGGR